MSLLSYRAVYIEIWNNCVLEPLSSILKDKCQILVITWAKPSRCLPHHFYLRMEKGVVSEIQCSIFVFLCVDNVLSFLFFVDLMTLYLIIWRFVDISFVGIFVL